MKTTKTITTVTDDLGGPGAAETIRFEYDGKRYELDLNKRNRETFERRVAAAYKPFVDAAREIGTTSSKPDLAAVREWAAAHGWAISARGRVPQQIQDAYDEAHRD